MEKGAERLKIALLPVEERGGKIKRIPSFKRIFKALREAYKKKQRIRGKAVMLKRSAANPIIKPRQRLWEAKGTFNAGAIRIKGTTHILYRAVSDKNKSSIGYAATRNGIKITERLPDPIYVPREEFEISKNRRTLAGCEDPRVVKIGGRIYMSYTAFAGNFQSIRLALTSISVKDFLNKKWRWTKPVPMSPFNKTNKNFVLFPEKIKGKFAILSRLSPEISIRYINNPDKFFDGTRFIDDEYKRIFRKNFWDSWVRGAGAPPIKTRLGWLVLYHAVEKSEPHKYKLGAMILDLKNPTKILYRSLYPLLAPDVGYENRGKPGVVYCCGATLNKDTLFVYYGGADKVVSVATIKLKDLLNDLKENNAVELEEGYEI